MSHLFEKLSEKYASLGFRGLIKAACRSAGDALYYRMMFCKNNVLRHFITLPCIEADLVLSLGPACRPAHYLRELGLRTFASPFDWMMCYDLAAISDFFEKGFGDFFRHWEAEDMAGGKNWRVRDTQTGMVSVHHFPRTEPVECTHAAFLTKMQQRFERTVHHIAAAKTVCFVSNREAECAALENFLLQMDRRFPDHEFIAVNIITSQKEYFEQIYIKNNIIIYNIYFEDINRHGKHDPATWLGNVEKWHKYLSYVRLKKSR